MSDRISTLTKGDRISTLLKGDRVSTLLKGDRIPTSLSGDRALQFLTKRLFEGFQLLESEHRV